MVFHFSEMKRIQSYLSVSIFGVSTACLLFTACIPEPLEVKNIPVLQAQIVVSSQIIADQGVVVLLTKSFGALDANEDSDAEALLNQLAINDAVVLLKSDNETDTLLFIESGLYGGITQEFEIDQVYELVIESPTMGKVRASTTVKQQILFEEIDAQLSFNGFDDTLVQVTYNFIDPTERNWYMVNVQRFSQQTALENVLNPQAFTRLMTDDEFNGGRFGESFRAFPRDYKPGDTVAVFLSNISEPYYQFLQLRQDNRFTFIEFISEPINYPSNVEGGLGFFNLYLPDIRLFVLEENEDGSSATSLRNDAPSHPR
jgi:hypothetical protein